MTVVSSVGKRQEKIGRLKERHLEIILVLVAMLFGLFIRLLFISKFDFPINDGGMFYVMVKDLIAGGFSFPAFTTYNNAQIPYAYSPLSFYLLGFLHQFLHLDLLALLRVYPLFFNVLTIPAFYLLARTILKNGASAVYSTFAFALLFPSFEWLIMGGGATRSPAYLVSILAMHQIALAAQTGRWKNRALAALCAGLTALFHLEMFWLVGVTGLWLTWRYARNRGGILNLALIFAGAGILIAPYAVAVLRWHGLFPFLAALSAGEFSSVNSVMKLIIFNITEERFVTVMNALALVGLLRCLARKEFGLVAWLLLILLLDPRSVNRSAVLPGAMFIGIAIHEVFVPGMRRLNEKWPDQASLSPAGAGPDSDLLQDFSTGASRGALSLLLFFIFISAYLSVFAPDEVLDALHPHDREAMAWVTRQTPPGSAFLVQPMSSSWQYDQVSEWFPALTGRTNLLTVQGTEWFPDNLYLKVWDRYARLRDCPYTAEGCSQILISDLAGRFDYIYVHVDLGRESKNDGNLNLIHELQQDPAYRLVYQNDLVTIFQVNP